MKYILGSILLLLVSCGMQQPTTVEHVHTHYDYVQPNAPMTFQTLWSTTGSYSKSCHSCSVGAVYTDNNTGIFYKQVALNCTCGDGSDPDKITNINPQNCVSSGTNNTNLVIENDDGNLKCSKGDTYPHTENPEVYIIKNVGGDWYKHGCYSAAVYLKQFGGAGYVYEPTRFSATCTPGGETLPLDLTQCEINSNGFYDVNYSSSKGLYCK